MFASPARSWILPLCLLSVFSLPTHARQLPPLPQLPLPLPPPVSFGPGDIMVSLETGPVQWRLADGTLRALLVPTVVGTGEGMAFDAAGTLYVTRWCTDAACQTGNTVEKYGTLGLPAGTTGRTYNCQPHTILFDSAGAAYVGQAGCNKSILKHTSSPATDDEYMVAEENYGVFWMDLAADGCTMFYTSVGPNVKRYDMCGRTQLADFNAAPLPGGITHDLRVLPDGGVLVSSGQVIARLNSSGVLVQTYEVPGEGALWAGVELAGDGTFWAANYFSSNVHHFNLNGTRIGGFNSGTPANTVVALRIKK